MKKNGEASENPQSDPQTESGQTLQGSFSAVSKPIFATKYSFESSRRDLHHALCSTAFQSPIFRPIPTIRAYL